MGGCGSRLKLCADWGPGHGLNGGAACNSRKVRSLERPGIWGCSSHTEAVSTRVLPPSRILPTQSNPSSPCVSVSRATFAVVHQCWLRDNRMAAAVGVQLEACRVHMICTHSWDKVLLAHHPQIRGQSSLPTAATLSVNTLSPSSRTATPAASAHAHNSPWNQSMYTAFMHSRLLQATWPAATWHGQCGSLPSKCCPAGTVHVQLAH